LKFEDLFLLNDDNNDSGNEQLDLFSHSETTRATLKTQRLRRANQVKRSYLMDNEYLRDEAQRKDLRNLELPIKQASLREKSVENILKGIENSKAIPFERVLYAIGIRYVGEVTAKYLARYFGSIEQLQQATLEELTQVEEVGEKVGQSIFDFFQDSENTAIIARLKSSGLQMKTKLGTAAIDGVLGGKTFVVSGVFSVSRDDIKRKVEENGGKISSSISSKTDYVLAGENMGPEKKKKAEKLGITILNEKDFFTLISQ
jgi:DNA ligase (NAD+)